MIRKCTTITPLYMDIHPNASRLPCRHTYGIHIRPALGAHCQGCPAKRTHLSCSIEVVPWWSPLVGPLSWWSWKWERVQGETVKGKTTGAPFGKLKGGEPFERKVFLQIVLLHPRVNPL